MQEARAKAARTVYEKYQKGDTDWLINLQLEASEVLPQRINEQAAKLDFSRSDLT